MTSLDRAVAYWSFGWLPSDRLPAVALEALERGTESPSIIELASADSAANPDLHPLFEKALTELGRTRLARAEAGRMIARDYAEQICNEAIKPVDGARAIWRVSLECPELEGELGIFGGRVSEYEGLSDGRERISAMIVSEARELIKQDDGRGIEGRSSFF
jgi:hypothetical protein